MFVDFMRQAFQRGIASKIGYLLAKPAFKQMRMLIDPRSYNGAVFVGLNGISVKSHGGMDGAGYANAIGVAVDLVRGGFTERIQADLEQSYVIPQELSEDERRAAIS